jgi:hypothetical protein
MRWSVALLFLAGALAAQTPEPEPQGTIRGVVKDSAGAPMPDVSVVAAQTRPAGLVTPPRLTVRMASLSAVTDEQGSYVLAGLPPGTYTVSTMRDRATNASKLVKLDSGEEVTVDLAIPADPTISGRVLHQNKEPAIDALVWLLKAEYQSGVLQQRFIGPKVTEEDGSYAFDTGLEVNRRYSVLVDMSAPEEMVAARAPDIKDREPIEVPTYYPSATGMESAAPVVLQPGERRERVDIRIATASYYCIDGKIQASGKPSSSLLTIQERALAGSRLVRLGGSSGEDGKFHICGLSPGLYRLSTEGGSTDFAVSDSDVEHVDLSVDTASLRLRVDWDGDTPSQPDPDLDPNAYAMLRKVAVALGLSDVSTDADLKQLATRISKGDILYADRLNAALKDEDTAAALRYLAGRLANWTDSVNVTLAGASGGLTQSTSARIPFEGPFQSSIPAGDYNVAVRPFGPGDSYAKEVTYNDLKIADGVLRLAPGSSGTLRILMGRGTATLAVTVSDAEGKPAPDATVILMPDSVTSVALLSKSAMHGQTDQNGNFTSRLLMPGKYRVLASAQSMRWDAPEDLEKVLPVMYQAKEVELGPGSTLAITLQPAPIF